MSDSNIPGLATTGAVVGVVFGLALQGGIFCLMSGFSFFLFGNAISGLQRGEFMSLFGRYALFGSSYSRQEEPGAFWLNVIMEFAFGIFILAAFFYNYKDAYPAGPG